jgi:YbgC/YbaW family acyl-CoA thioester hydrolase
MYNSSTKTFSLPISVEFEDIDSYNIVHNTRIIDYFERARVHFLIETIGLDLYPQKTGIVLYSLDIRFNKAARLLDALHATAVIISMDEYRLELAYRLLRGTETLARATSGIAFMDIGTGTLIAAPEQYKEKIRPYIKGSANLENG